MTKKKGLAVYQCDNPACSLGIVGHPGHFTGGITESYAYSLDPSKPQEDLEEGVDYGEGFCPNCGKPGSETGDEHVSHAGPDADSDPGGTAAPATPQATVAGDAEVVKGGEQ